MYIASTNIKILGMGGETTNFFNFAKKAQVLRKRLAIALVEIKKLTNFQVLLYNHHISHQMLLYSTEFLSGM